MIHITRPLPVLESAPLFRQYAEYCENVERAIREAFMLPPHLLNPGGIDRTPATEIYNRMHERR